MPSEQLRDEPIYGVILAAGQGTRFGSNVPKQFVRLGGKEIYKYALETFTSSKLFTKVLLVVPSEDLDRISLSVATEFENVIVVSGGETRNESTKNALSTIDNRDGYVLIHDAARPFLTLSIIEKNVFSLRSHNAVDTVITSDDTLVEVSGSGFIANIPDRKNMRRGQTPQGFRIGTLVDAYSMAVQAGDFNNSDDCSVVSKYLPNERIALVEGNGENFKITSRLDFFLAEKLLFSEARAASSVVETERSASLRDKVVVIFGGSGGIAHSLKSLLEKTGSHVEVFSRSQGNVDISDPEMLKATLESVNEKRGRIDVVVHLAAQMTVGSLSEQNIESTRSMVAVNYTSAVELAYLSYEYLKSSRGQFVFFGSSSYSRGRSHFAVYSSTKAAIVNLAEALKVEWAEDGINVVCINPGRTNTKLRSSNFGVESLDELLTPEKVARVTVDALFYRDLRSPIDVTPGIQN